MGLIPTLNHPVAGNSRVPGPLYDNDVAIRAVVNGGIEAANITAASVTDACLASPNNSVYRTLAAASSLVTDSITAATYFFRQGNIVSASPLTINSNETIGGLIYIDDADFTTASKTVKLRVRGAVACNGTAWSSVTATFGLYPVTFSGTADTMILTLGTVVSGSTAAVANPTANGAMAPVVSTDFNVPSDGYYALGVVTSATVTADSRAILTAHLQQRAT